jgi:hypothetical protein
MGITVIQEATLIAQAIGAERLRLSGLQWKLEQVLHRHRIAKVGASGIQHRVIETEEEVNGAVAQALQEIYAEMDVQEARNQWFRRASCNRARVVSEARVTGVDRTERAVA